MSSMMTSGGFGQRSSQTERFVDATETTILKSERYINIPTGIEHRFGDQASQVHDLLYRSMSTTTDLLRYFPDNLYLDRKCLMPTWENSQNGPQLLSKPAEVTADGLFSFFVEYKYSDSERKSPIGSVPTRYIGIIEREAWLTYKRLTHENPALNIYLDGKRTFIALFYAASYAPDFLYAQWEHLVEPIAIRPEVARPNKKSVSYSTGSGTPWINFDLRTFKPLDVFLTEDLYWDPTEAKTAVKNCKTTLSKKS
jgi:hypothetical protein